MLECHIEIAICTLEVFMQPLGLKFYALQEQLLPNGSIRN